MQGKKVLLAAADTFRAAAVEQLGIWAERTGSGFHSKGQDADPAAVAWEAMDVAIRDQYDILFIDTAGRLHTKSNLMDELHKIREVIARKHPGAPHRSILIVDATTGQNALQQTKIFKEAAGIDELILTKLDGTAKGGVAVAVSMQYGIPITYVGLGEKMEDLRPSTGMTSLRRSLSSKKLIKREELFWKRRPPFSLGWVHFERIGNIGGRGNLSEESFPFPKSTRVESATPFPKFFVPIESPFTILSEAGCLWNTLFESGNTLPSPLLLPTLLTFFRFFPKVCHPFTRDPSSKNTLWSGQDVWGKHGKALSLLRPSALPLFLRRRPACTTSTI